MRHIVLSFLGLVFLLLTVSCTRRPVYSPWEYADLRLLDPVDNSTPATDILAVYTRATNLTVDIRLDLLDIDWGDHYVYEISLWDNENYFDEPLMIEIFSSGAVRTTGTGDGKPVVRPRVIQDLALDTVTVSLNRTFIGDRCRLDVSTYTVDPVALADEIRDIRSDSQPPASRAPLLIALWDDYPATTPAQALRRWDGAHTGPLGGRHGLKYVLDAVTQYQLPVTLLDIKNPASLAALDFVGGLGQVQALNRSGLLTLPDAAYSAPTETALDFSRRAAAGFDLPDSRFVYATSSDEQQSLLSGYSAQFLSLADRSHLLYSGGTRLIPLPAENAVEATEDGPSLDVRRALVEAAFSADPADLVVLGGSLPNSTWGSPDMADPTFAWLASHPWIQPLDGNSLLTFPLGGRYVAPDSGAVDSTPLLEALRSAPENPITDSAWLAYLTLNAPSGDPQLQELRANYLGQVSELLAAARWADNPFSKIDCNLDLDADGQNECILANESYFAILDPSGARLTNLFFLDDAGPHQLIGPSSQFTVGLSDSSEWRLANGEGADPMVIPGAFADDSETWTQYTASLTEEGVIFTSPNGERIKSYRLLENGVEARYQLSGAVSAQVPLAIGAQNFFLGPTDYLPSLAVHSWTWSLLNGIGVEVRTEAMLSAQGYTSTVPFLGMPEDPNLGYPQGSYLPFPLSVVTINGSDNFSVQIINK